MKTIKLAARISLCWVVALGAWPLHGFAQSLNTQAAHYKINLIESVWRVNADATSVLESAVEREAFTDAGAQLVGKFAQTVNQALQKFEVLEAYTLKADGRKIPVSKDSIQVQNGIATTGSGPSWPEWQVHLITFPDLTKGDKSVWRTRLTTHTPVLPNWASYQEFVIPGVAYDSVSITIEAPKALALNVFSGGGLLQKTQSDQNETWKIEFKQPIAGVADNSPANTLVSYPRVFASTFKTHEELADAFARQAQAKVVMNAEIKALANDVTEGQADTFNKAKAIHDWVRKNIRYVAVYLGTDGWVPHSTDWILSNRYGDCKDHVLLTQTLLKAAGIEAVPALINTSSEYELTELPIGFDHSILYLPDLQIFADPTDKRIPFGSLPWADSDKPSAVALAGGAQILRTPKFDPATNHSLVRTHLKLAKDGGATGTIEFEANGYAATELQDNLEQIPSGMDRFAVQKILDSSRLRGRGGAEYPAVQRNSQSQKLKLPDLVIYNLLTDPHAGAISPHPELNLQIYVQRNLFNYTAEKRDLSYPCTRFGLREEFELEFDPAYQILRIPTDIKETHPDGIAFEAHYTREGNTVKGWREFVASQTSHVCSPAQYAARRDVMNRIAQHLRSTVLYQQ